jgi:hypothetical protein
MAFLSFHMIFLLTSAGQTGKPIPMIEGSNDAFPSKEVPVTVVLWLVYNWHLLAYRLTVPDWLIGLEAWLCV